MGEAAERLLRAQLGGLEAERDRLRRELEVKTAAAEALGRTVAALGEEKHDLQRRLDVALTELRQARSEKSIFVPRALPVGRAREATIPMEPAGLSNG